MGSIHLILLGDLFRESAITPALSNHEIRKVMISRSALVSGVAVICCLVSLPAVAADRNVDVINNTQKKITGFYASRTKLKSWQENIVKGDPIDPGETQPVDIDDGSGGCHFDFKAVFADGDEAINEDVDVCSVNSVTYK